jgi:hypothetical protein
MSVAIEQRTPTPPEQQSPHGRRWSRRQLLSAAAKTGVGAIAVAGSGYVGYRWPHPTKAPPVAPVTSDVAHFKSRPDLSPPQVTVTRVGRFFTPGSGAPNAIVLAPRGYTTDGPGQQGPMILDTNGRLLWFLHTQQIPMDVQVQHYQGQPVLTWWQGAILNGYGEGTCVVYDSSYRQVATVQAGNGLQADLHEFQITPQNTALITAYRTTTLDLSSLGGSTQGQTLEGVAQEIEIASGKLLFEWRSLDHVDIAESYMQPPGGAPFDYFHINSIAIAPDGDLLISARNTWAVYKVSRQTGQIVWRLNGTKSDFTLGTGAAFYWQHDVRPQGPNQISIFDDGATPPEEAQSRGILLNLDSGAKTASLARRYVHPAKLLAANQGSMQILPDGRVFVGWGAQPYFSEFSQEGQLLLDGRFPADDQSYRAYSYDWTGQPVDAPAVAVGPNGAGGSTVYASWNGATQIVRWQVLAGKDSNSLQPVASAAHTGFETVISVNSTGPYFGAIALDRAGKELGRSQAVKA